LQRDQAFLRSPALAFDILKSIQSLSVFVAKVRSRLRFVFRSTIRVNGKRYGQCNHRDNGGSGQATGGG
jgi:hypothetical protein